MVPSIWQKAYIYVPWIVLDLSSAGGGLRMTLTSQKYLATQRDRELAAKIDGATQPAVRRLLCSPTTFAEEE
jgi:hypothetical protein